MSACLLLLAALLVRDLAAHDNDGCPHNFRRCNDDCLDRNNKNIVPCEQGPWGKCLSATFPFFCPLTNTCIKKDQICGEDCFDGSPESFWYDHWNNTKKDWYEEDTWVKKDNDWMLTYGDKDIMESIDWNIKIPKWLERYNCNGVCKSYLEPCNGSCDHPEPIKKGGKTFFNPYPLDLVKCGKQCRLRSDLNWQRLHDCGDDCLPESLPCNGICAHSDRDGPQRKCGNECRPDHEYEGAKWRACPDGSCRDKSVQCDGPLPGSCPEDQVLCKYNHEIRGTDFECRSKETHYACNETVEKHKDETCNTYDERCGGECRPGYMKCLIDNLPRCAHPDKWVKCGDECKPCIEKTEMCHGLCTTGYKECQGKCVSVSNPDFIDCNGTCQPVSEPCEGECSEGFGKADSKCVPVPNGDYYECEGYFLKHESPCNGVCRGQRIKCRGDRCLERWLTRPCEGEVCIHEDEPCNGTCPSTYRPTLCGNKCIREDEPCDGKCVNEKYLHLCEDPSLGHEICLATEKIRDGNKDCKDGSDETTLCFQTWKCNGTVQCINKPCHGSEQNKCLESVERKVDSEGSGSGSDTETYESGSDTETYESGSDTETYKMYYCAEEDECKEVGTPCGGKCVQDMYGQRTTPIKPKDQFACHDGSKCVTISNTCDGSYDCPDGSDEICRCQGKSDCEDRLQNSIKYNNYINYKCKSMYEVVKMSEYCDGKDDCTDGSDEEGCDECPGLTRCANGWITCANVPCNNPYSLWSGDLRCEASFASENGIWRLCEETGKEARCVKGAGGIDDRNFYKGEVIKGELCGDECLGAYVEDEAYRCGDECLPHNQNGMPQFSCNGSCEHLNKDSNYKLSPCGDYCVREDELVFSGEDQNVVTCDGECRYFYWKDIQETSSRKTCNGVCLNGTSDEPWFSCASGDECFSKEEWCNGVSDCKDGTDEANCIICPKIKKCQHENHPLEYQTSSKGPRFPEYVCEDEPCGECLDSDKFPCGDYCIPSDEICLLSGLCSSSAFKCGDECLPFTRVCDGRFDCADASDEENCKERNGSWMCQGTIQPRSQPCL